MIRNSELHASAQMRDKGIESVKAKASEVSVVDKD